MCYELVDSKEVHQNHVQFVEEDLELNEKLRKIDFVDLVVDDLLDSLLSFPRDNNAAIGNTYKSKDEFSIFNSNLGCDMIHFNGIDIVPMTNPLPMVMEKDLKIDIKVFVFTHNGNTWERGRGMSWFDVLRRWTSILFLKIRDESFC